MLRPYGSGAGSGALRVGGSGGGRGPSGGVGGPAPPTLIGRRPWTVFRVGRICGEVHAQLHEVPAPRIIPSLKDTLKRRIETTGPLPRRLAGFALAGLDGPP